MEIDSKLIQLLMEIGYLAGGYGLTEESETIFEGVSVARPESEYPYIGLAVTKMNAGQNRDAIKILWEQALRLNPESDLAKSFLGLALKLSGLSDESETVLKEVIDSDRDQEAVRMARDLIAEMG